MWHEARKQEKKLRTLVVDYKRRAERRREFYEKFKADPTQFMQVHGRSCKIYLDPQVSQAAENCMMPWQGNKDNMIDRFDVRSNLDIIPEHVHKEVESTGDDRAESMLNYERYRILIQNEATKTSEDKFLHQIHLEEQFGTAVPARHGVKDREGKHNKETQQKAAIAYSYEDSTPAAQSWKDKAKAGGKEEEEEEESEEEVDFDLLVNMDDLAFSQKAELNVSGTKYGLGGGDFMTFLNRDLEEKERLRLAKLQEEEKQAMSGRKARRERRAFKDRIISRKGYISPPSYAAPEKVEGEEEEEENDRSSSGSRSGSSSPEKIEFITSFGGDEEEKKKSPSPPPRPTISLQRTARKWARSRSRSPQRRKMKSLSRSRSRSRDRRKRRKRSTSSSSSDSSRDRRRRRRRSSSSRSRSRNRGRKGRRGGRSRTRSRSRSRTRNGKRRSRSRSRDRGRRRRSPERRKSPKRRSSSTSSSSSRSRSSRRSRRRRKSSTTSKSSKSRDSPPPPPRRTLPDVVDLSCIPLPSTSPLRQIEPPPKLPSPPVKRYYGRKKLSSDSDSDKISLPSSDEDQDSSKHRSNFGSRGKSGAQTLKVQTAASSTPGSSGSKPLTAAERLKRKMQAQLNRHLKADKEAEKLKQEKMDQERLEREETLRQLTIKYRKRERERRHREIGGRSRSRSSDSSGKGFGSSSRSSSRSRSPSPSDRRQRESNSP